MITWQKYSIAETEYVDIGLAWKLEIETRFFDFKLSGNMHNLIISFIWWGKVK